MKTIGIILRSFNANYKDIGLYGITTEITRYLRKYDVNVIAIPVVFETNDKQIEIEKVKNIINMCDGIIFPGGIKIFEIDHEIVKYCYETDMPTLGLCLGMQIIGETFDGTVRKLENQSHNKEDKYVHKVNINKKSKLYQILQTDELIVNSRHNNYVEKTSLECSAISDDGVIEAIEDSSKKFFFGIQWHPESLIEDKNSTKLFDYFIESLNF